jgi:Uma2 family endonuclease
MTVDGIEERRITRLEYERMIECGIFVPGDRVELIAGALLVAEPQGTHHSAAIGLVAEALRAAFGAGWYVMVQAPLALDADSEPEPDVAVVPGAPRDYRDAHPSRPVLVVEVAKESLPGDRGRKGSLYARAGVADYWIVDVAGGALEVYRVPQPAPEAPLGWRYGDRGRLTPGEAISPLAAPRAAIAVADLLP